MPVKDREVLLVELRKMLKGAKLNAESAEMWRGEVLTWHLGRVKTLEAAIARIAEHERVERSYREEIAELKDSAQNTAATHALQLCVEALAKMPLNRLDCRRAYDAAMVLLEET